MKKTITSSIKDILADRQLLLLSLGLIILAVSYIIYVSFSINPTELQIAIRYTAFGDTQYYRNKWYYLFAFIAFAVVVVISHIGLMAKLAKRDMRPIALALGWMTVILLVILALITRSVLGIAYLS